MNTLGPRNLFGEAKFSGITIQTDKGSVQAHLYGCAASSKVVIAVGGVEGGFDSPAKGLYPTLGEALKKRGISTLRIKYRNPQNLIEATYDVRAGIDFLLGNGSTRLGLIGHSFGGAAVIQAACDEPAVTTVITLASQSYGTECVSRLSSGVAILLIHGMKDSMLPFVCSERIFSLAHGPKKLILIKNAGHSLNEASGPIRIEVEDWLIRHM